MSEQAFWYDGGPRDPDYLGEADPEFGGSELYGASGFLDDPDDLDDDDDGDEYLPN
jgi:hypothetical protein